MAKYKVKNLKKRLKFLSKLFAENGRGKIFSNDSSFLSNLKNTKGSTTPTI